MLSFKVNTFRSISAYDKINITAMQRLNDGWLRLIGIPVAAFVITFFFYAEDWIKYGHSFWFCYLNSLTIALVIWYFNREIIIFFSRRFPQIEVTFKRISLQLITSFLFSGTFSLLVSYFYDKTGFWNRDLIWPDYTYNVLVILFFVLLISGLYEGSFYFARWRFSVKETEELKKANLQSQLESLKNQVSPHFLFNSLNTLSSLIEENPDTAIRFVNQLSRVYRYLLQSNEKELTSLKEELEFLQAYFFLLKTRFGEGLSLQVELPDDYLNSLIPPLTLQILLENAVKHNIVSINKPLNISVRVCTEETVCVINNIQKKTLNVASNGMGLANIAAKYRLLNKPALKIDETGVDFIVTLPIIKN